MKYRIKKSSSQKGYRHPSLTPVAVIRTPWRGKFGVPRQSGLAGRTRCSVVFEPPFRDRNAVRGLEVYDYIWLIWGFSQVPPGHRSLTVRPPVLGGNVRRGVFATRSPFRPNGLGLSSVRLADIEYDKELGPVLHVTGADMTDGTPIFDIKPYLPYTDSHPGARGGISAEGWRRVLQVEIPEPWRSKIPPHLLESVRETLAQDPRPAYIQNPDRVYGLRFENLDIRFAVKGKVLTVCGCSEV